MKKKSSHIDFYLRPEQWYLEISRSVLPLYIASNSRNKALKKDINTHYNMICAWSTVTIVFSCMAIEGFCNKKLWDVWKIYKQNPTSAIGRHFEKIMKDVSNYRKFESLKNHPNVRELGERIKTLCKLYNIKSVYEVDKKLWNEFKILVEKCRHFLIHPLPDPEKFDKHFKIISNTELGKYSTIAEKVIKHFWNELKKKPPTWLDQNELFKVSSIEYLGGKVPVAKR